MKYSEIQTQNAVTWKACTENLPDEARTPAAYVNKSRAAEGPLRDICLPPSFAQWSLLPEVREQALSLFTELGIPWHAGVDDGPSNHLLSSQVQCVNALGRMVRDPERIKRAFGDLVDTDEVLEVEPGRHLTFEYIGPEDFFSEQPAGPRTRGARCTSVDAAFKHRATDGAIELVLIEWKYTESYLWVRDPDPRRDKTRARRYASFAADQAGPIRADVLSFELLLDEPFYQLVRQQLLAHELEKIGAEGASRVRVLHVLAPDNREYQKSLPRQAHRDLGDTVSEAWHQLLRHRDRFVSVDPGIFLNPEITSEEYVLRYADDVIWDQAGLLEALGYESANDIEDALYAQYDFDGDVAVQADGIELIQSGRGIQLPYPFRDSDLGEVVDELDEE